MRATMRISEYFFEDKIKNTYVRMNDNYKDCEFEYQGWIK